MNDGPATTTWELMRSDVDRYVYMLDRDGTAMIGRPGGRLRELRAILMSQGLQASLVYRFGHAMVSWAPRTRAGHCAQVAGLLSHFVASRVVQATAGIHLTEHARIGPGLYIGHFGGVFVNGAAVIGANCNLHNDVVIGDSAIGSRPGAPVLGDRVWVGPGAKVVGPIEVGSDAVVGANVVLTRSVPALSRVSNPAPVVLPGHGSFDMVLYRGSGEDPGRQRAQEAGRNRVGGLRRPSEPTA